VTTGGVRRRAVQSRKGLAHARETVRRLATAEVALAKVTTVVWREGSSCVRAPTGSCVVTGPRWAHASSGDRCLVVSGHEMRQEPPACASRQASLFSLQQGAATTTRSFHTWVLNLCRGSWFAPDNRQPPPPCLSPHTICRAPCSRPIKLMPLPCNRSTRHCLLQCALRPLSPHQLRPSHWLPNSIKMIAKSPSSVMLPLGQTPLHLCLVTMNHCWALTVRSGSQKIPFTPMTVLRRSTQKQNGAWPLLTLRHLLFMLPRPHLHSPRMPKPTCYHTACFTPLYNMK
jgi:hypothetical protein